MWRRALTIAARSFNRFTITKSKPSKLPHIFKGSMLAFPFTKILAQSIESSNDSETAKVANMLKEACKKNEEAMKNLIKTLNACVEEICEQYQHCLMKQIDLTLQCSQLDGSAESQWDDLTMYRVEAGELKSELEKYFMLIERIGQIVQNQLCLCMLPGHHERNYVVSDYESLKSLMLQKNEENKYWEGRLLDVKTQSILSGYCSVR